MSIASLGLFLLLQTLFFRGTGNGSTTVSALALLLDVLAQELEVKKRDVRIPAIVSTQKHRDSAVNDPNNISKEPNNLSGSVSEPVVKKEVKVKKEEI